MMPANPMLDVAAHRHDEWVPLLEQAAREVFELMLGSRLTASVPNESLPLDVTAMVGLAGQLSGVLSLRCQTRAAALMASRMLGVDLDKIGPEISDAIGEVGNMVAGNFKNKITGLAEGCMLSPPTIVTGSDYTLHSLSDTPALEVKLMFENMPIVICLEIHS
jgi:chemotaxis protein CheX